jgi:hypothetical protein
VHHKTRAQLAFSYRKILNDFQDEVSEVPVKIPGNLLSFFFCFGRKNQFQIVHHHLLPISETHVQKEECQIRYSIKNEVRQQTQWLQEKPKQQSTHSFTSSESDSSSDISP